MSANRIRNLFIFFLLDGAVAQTLFEQQCLSLPATYKGVGLGDCFVRSSGTMSRSPVNDPCTELENGRLAFVPNSVILNIILSITSSNLWIGLRQANTTGSLTDYWQWEDGRGNTYPEPYLADLWCPNQPNSGTHMCGYIESPTGLFADWGCTSSYHKLCQYVNKRQKYSMVSKGKRAADHAIIGNVTVPVKAAALRCGQLCKDHPLCYGFSIDESTGHCLTERDTGTCPEFPLVDDPNYDMYARADPQ